MRGWRNAAFALLSIAARTLHLAARASLYLAARTLRRQALTEAITRTWDEFSRGDAAILSGLRSWEKAWYEHALKPADHILLVGSGTGRDLIALLELGYRVEGIDISARAIELARRMLQRRHLSAELHIGPIEGVVPPGTFDAVIFSWFCYGYIPERQARIAVLLKIKRISNQAAAFSSAMCRPKAGRDPCRSCSRSSRLA